MEVEKFERERKLLQFPDNKIWNLQAQEKQRQNGFIL